jgi:hypothetical protein
VQCTGALALVLWCYFLSGIPRVYTGMKHHSTNVGVVCTKAVYLLYMGTILWQLTPTLPSFVNLFNCCQLLSLHSPAIWEGLGEPSLIPRPFLFRVHFHYGNGLLSWTRPGNKTRVNPTYDYMDYSLNELRSISRAYYSLFPSHTVASLQLALFPVIASL